MSLPSWLYHLYQTDLFNDSNTTRITNANSKVLIGQYFEQLSLSIFPKAIPVPKSDQSFEPDFIIPYTTSKPYNTIIEIKAAKDGHLIDYGQLQYYSTLKDTSFPYTSPKMYYTLFYYSLSKNIVDYHIVGDLIEALNNTYKIAYIYSIESMMNLSNTMVKYQYGKWVGYEFKRDKYIRFSRAIRDLMLHGTHSSIRNAFKLIDKDIDCSFSMIKPLPPISSIPFKCYTIKVL